MFEKITLSIPPAFCDGLVMGKLPFVTDMCGHDFILLPMMGLLCPRGWQEALPVEGASHTGVVAAH